MLQFIRCHHSRRKLSVFLSMAFDQFNDFISCNILTRRIFLRTDFIKHIGNNRIIILICKHQTFACGNDIFSIIILIYQSNKRPLSLSACSSSILFGSANFHINSPGYGIFLEFCQNICCSRIQRYRTLSYIGIYSKTRKIKKAVYTARGNPTEGDFY